MFGFIGTLLQSLLITINSTIADLHNLLFIVTHALGLTVFTSRLLLTELQQSHCD
jgi:hypothetical protein